MEGAMLSAVEGSDLKMWGINKFADRKFLEQQIAKLVGNQVNKPAANAAPLMANEGGHAPTAFIG